MDTDNSGLIDKNELKKAIEKANIYISQQEIDKIVEEVNIRGNGEINYSEFIAATIEAKKMLTNEKLYALFKEFDHQDINVLTINNIKVALRRMGRDLSIFSIE